VSDFIRVMTFRVRNSALMMTWLSFVTRSGIVIFVLPLILVQLNPVEISIWFIVVILNRIRDVFDMGFVDNFSREISYSLGNSNVKVLKEVVNYASRVYLILCFASGMSLLLIGLSILLMKYGAGFIDFEKALTLIVVSVSSAAHIYGNRYVSFLYGSGKIADMKFWDSIFNFANILALIAFLLVLPSVVAVVVVNSIFILSIVLRNSLFYRSALNDIGSKGFQKIEKKSNLDVKKRILKNSLRELYSSIFGVGLVQLANIIITVKFPVSVSNQYMLIDSLVEQLKGVARAPFYTARPKMAMYLESQIGAVKNLAYFSRPMMYSHMVFAIGFMFLLFFGDVLLIFIGSKIEFSMLFCIAIGLAGLAERYSGMHNQLFVIASKKIVSHMLMPGVCGIAGLVVFFLGYDVTPAFYSLGLLVGYVVGFSWVVAMKNYEKFETNFWAFEYSSGFIFITFTLCFACMVCLM